MLVYSHKREIVDDTMLSDCQPLGVSATYALYTQIFEPFLKNYELLIRLEILHVAIDNNIDLFKSHVDSSALYSIKNDEVDGMIEAAGYFTKKPGPKTPPSTRHRFITPQGTLERVEESKHNNFQIEFTFLTKATGKTANVGQRTPRGAKSIWRVWFANHSQKMMAFIIL